MTTEAEVIKPPELGTPEYDAAMALKAEQAMNPPADRPEWLPEKFKSPEEMANAYSELEKKQSQPVTPPAEPKPPVVEPPNTEGDAKDAVEKAGLDFNALKQDYSTNQGLSDESYKSLEDAGIPKEIVDAYIEGQKALGAAIETSAYTAVGGKEEYQKMTEWAATNMGESEVAAFNKATNGTQDELLLAVSGLRDRYRSANGNSPSLLSGGAGSGQSSPGFSSAAEMTAAMKDPRYQKDPAYRKSVEAKLQNATFF